MTPLLLQLVSLAMKLIERHRASNPDDDPLTAEQVTQMLTDEIKAGEHRDLQWFLSKNRPPPV